MLLWLLAEFTHQGLRDRIPQCFVGFQLETTLRVFLLLLLCFSLFVVVFFGHVSLSSPSSFIKVYGQRRQQRSSASRTTVTISYNLVTLVTVHRLFPVLLVGIKPLGPAHTPREGIKRSVKEMGLMRSHFRGRYPKAEPKYSSFAPLQVTKIPSQTSQFRKWKLCPSLYHKRASLLNWLEMLWTSAMLDLLHSHQY